MKQQINESYEVSSELEETLNSILSDEFLAHENYLLGKIAMKGNKNHILGELAEKNGDDELKDHFANLVTWMQSKGLKPVTSHKEMEKLTTCTKFNITDEASTEEILDSFIIGEKEAIDRYEEVLEREDVKLDLEVMLAGFLKDEREHLKELQDIKDEMKGFSGSDKVEKVDEVTDIGKVWRNQASRATRMSNHRLASAYYEGCPDVMMLDKLISELESYLDGEHSPSETKRFLDKVIHTDSTIGYEVGRRLSEIVDSDSSEMVDESDSEGYEYRVNHIEWDASDEEIDINHLPEELIVDVPEEICACDEEEDYISDYLSDTYGFCHNGFLFNPV